MSNFPHRNSNFTGQCFNCGGTGHKSNKCPSATVVKHVFPVNNNVSLRVNDGFSHVSSNQRYIPQNSSSIQSASAPNSNLSASGLRNSPVPFYHQGNLFLTNITCNGCSKKGHMVRACLNNRAGTVGETLQSNVGVSRTLMGEIDQFNRIMNKLRLQIRVCLYVNDKPFPALFDSGCMDTLMHISDYNCIVSHYAHYIPSERMPQTCGVGGAVNIIGTSSYQHKFLLKLQAWNKKVQYRLFLISLLMV